MRRRLLAVLSLAALLAVAGCAGLTSESGQEEPTAEQLQDRAIEQMGSVESYSFRTNTTVDVDEVTAETDINGALNRSTRTAELNTTTRINSSRGTNEQVLEIYIDNQTMYVSPAGQDRWQSVSVSEIAAYGGTNPWENDQVELQRMLLEDAEVEAVGNETVDGRSTTVIETRPTNESLDAFLEARSPQGSGFGGAEIESAELTQWITDDGYVVRTEVRMVLTVQGRTANVTARTEFDDLEGSVAVEVPDEVRGGEQA